MSLPGPARQMLTELRNTYAEADSQTWDQLAEKLTSTLGAWGGEAEQVEAEFNKVRAECENGRTRRAATRAIARKAYEVVADDEELEGYESNTILVRLDTEYGPVWYSGPGQVPEAKCRWCHKTLEAQGTNAFINHKAKCRTRQ